MADAVAFRTLISQRLPSHMSKVDGKLAKPQLEASSGMMQRHYSPFQCDTSFIGNVTIGIEEVLRG